MIRSLNFLEIKLRQPKVVFGITISILLIYLVPLLVYGQNLYIMTFDNLDSVLVWMKILAHSGMIFADSDAIVPNMMGGLPRHSYGSEFNVVLWLFYFFPPFTAYVINEIIIHITAFITMWFFLSYHVIKPTRGNTIVIATGALYFALLPFWPWGGLSVPAMPLVVHAMLNIRSRTATWRDWTVLALIPLYSSLVLVYFFFLIAAGLFWVVDSIRKRDWQWQLIGAIIFMGIIYLGVEYRLVYATFFDHGFTSHRIEFSGLFTKSLIKAYEEAYSVFLNGHNLAKGNHYLFLLPLIFSVLFLQWKKGRFSRSELFIIILIMLLAYIVDFWEIIFTSMYFFPLAIIMLTFIIYQQKNNVLHLEKITLILLIISLWSGFWYYEGWGEVKIYFPYIETFNMSRILYLEPFLWAIAAALTVNILTRKIHYPSLVIIFFLFSISYIAINNATFHKSFLAKMTYEEYFAEDIFHHIAQDIGKPKNEYRIVSLGIEPSVALYNGFYTIDGYSVNYPLKYKHKFRKIFVKEIPKNKYITWIYDQWGNKCYVMTRAVKYDSNGKSSDYSKLELDINQMHELGARYMITPLKIPDPSVGLKYLKSYHGKGESRRSIYLYEILLQIS